MEKTNAQIIKKNATNVGLTLGISLALITTLAYALSIELYTKWWFGTILFVFTVAFGIVSVSKSKGALNGFISFKEAFTSYFITILIGVLISTIVSILIFVVVDPDAAVFLQEKIIEMTVGMMERFGVPESEIAKQVEALQNTNSYSLGSQVQGFFISLVIYSVIGLLVSLIFKRNNPDLA